MVAHAVIICFVVLLFHRVVVVLLFHHVLLCCEFQQVVTLYHEHVSCRGELLMLLSDSQQLCECLLFELMKHIIRSA